jgi:tetratricopeptide (TPR) repeat protein
MEYISRGELDQAITMGEETLALGKKAGDLTIIPSYLFLLGEAYLKLGEWDKSEQYFREAADGSRNQDEPQISAWCHCYFGLLHFDKEEYTKARESLEEAINVAKKAENRAFQAFFSQFLIWTSIELGELEKAQNLLDSLQEFAIETEEHARFRINEMALRATLLRAQKKYTESIELFEKTLKEWQSTKADIWNAYYFARWVLCEYARVYLERNQEGDKEKAHSLLNQALEMFQKMGAKKDVEKILAKKKLLTS